MLCLIGIRTNAPHVESDPDIDQWHDRDRYQRKRNTDAEQNREHHDQCQDRKYEWKQSAKDEIVQAWRVGFQAIDEIALRHSGMFAQREALHMAEELVAKITNHPLSRDCLQ